MNRLPNLLLSHGHARHSGGAMVVASNHPPLQIWTGPRAFRSPSYREFIVSLGSETNRWRRIARGDSFAGWQVLHPEREDGFGQAADNALVLRSELGGRRVLLLSDLGPSGQAALLARERDLQADLVVAGLPGQGEALSDDLLRAIKPRLILVTDDERPLSARAGDALKKRLQACGAEVLYTSELGAVTLALRPDRLRVESVKHGELETGGQRPP